MAELMSELCRQGVTLIWKQCNDELFGQGLEYLEEAAKQGDADAMFFLGHCCSWGDGAVGFNDKKAYECYLAGACAGSARCVLGAVRAGQYDDRMKASAKYTLTECIQIVAEAAEAGDAFAAYQLADAFYYEDFYDILPKSERWAGNCLKWYEKAGQGGIVKAMERAGTCYFSGLYVRRNIEEGLLWADRAACAGSAWGLFQMGLYMLEQQEYEGAFDYFYAADKQGDDDASYYLGTLYESGRGIEKDVRQAIICFEKAAAHENRESLACLGRIYSGGEYEDREKAWYWLNRAYTGGEHSVAFELGKLCISEWEHQDLERAERLLAEYADQEKDGEACFLLASMYREGGVLEADMDKALNYYEKGASMGHEACREMLGILYFSGEEAPQNYRRAFELFSQCLETGFLTQFSALAYLWQNGFGCEKNEEKAAELYLMAAEKEKDGSSYYELGVLYEKGSQISRDLELAVDYYRKAALKGDDRARRRLNHFRRNLFGKWKIIS